MWTTAAEHKNTPIQAIFRLTIAEQQQELFLSMKRGFSSIVGGPSRALKGHQTTQ
jgi:hypothetical protein